MLSTEVNSQSSVSIHFLGHIFFSPDYSPEISLNFQLFDEKMILIFDELLNKQGVEAGQRLPIVIDDLSQLTSFENVSSRILQEEKVILSLIY